MLDYISKAVPVLPLSGFEIVSRHKINQYNRCRQGNHSRRVTEGSDRRDAHRYVTPRVLCDVSEFYYAMLRNGTLASSSQRPMRKHNIPS